MILSDLTLESINQNFADISSGWLWSSEDVYDSEYRHVYQQPLSVEAATLYDLKWQTSATTITIRKSSEPLSEVIWAGYCELIEEIPLNPLVWNDKYKTYDLPLINGVTQQVGMEFYLPYCHNESGELIENGRAVFITSGTDDDSLHIAKADKGNISGKYVIAVTTQDIPNGESGYCTKYGEVRNIDTSNLIANEPFYLDHNGAFTSARADFPDYSTRIGYCTISHPTSGQIYVDVVSETSIEDIYNVQITNPKEGDSFIYENNRWINRNFGDISHDPTGFSNPAAVTVSYDESTRCVTLSGTVEAYWRGNILPSLSAGWCSEPHALGVSGTQFLYYNGTDFIWSPVSWTFDQLQIAAVFYDSKGIYQFTLRECHGIMQHQVHQEFHINIGTYLIAGGDFVNYTINSTNAANRRPDISQIRIADEDLETTNLGLSTKNYMQFSLSGASADILFTSANDVVGLTGNQPIVNTYTGGVWGSTPLANNEHAAIFVMTIPQALDTKSQSKRYVFVQPQTANASLSLIQALSPNDLNLGQLAIQVPEYLFIGKIIVKYLGGNWTIVSIEKISGSKANQSLIARGFLSTVSVGPSLSGNGTPASPIDLVNSKTPGTYTKFVSDHYGIVTSGGYISATDIPYGIDALKISTGIISNTEFDHLNGTSANIQNQLNQLGQLAVSGSGAGTSNYITKFITSSSMGNSTIIDDGTTVRFTTPISATSISVGNVSNTEISYLDGVSANIQNQLTTLSAISSTKADKAITITAGTGLIGGGDLSTNRTISLATTGTAGTYTNIVTNNFGQVTSARNLIASDLPSGIDASKIADGSVTSTEFQYINTLSANAQNQLTALSATKADKTITITAGTGLTGGGDLSTNRTISLATTGTAGTYTKVTTNAYGQVTAGTTLTSADVPTLPTTKIGTGIISDTEFNYLDGTSANIQNQLTNLSATTSTKATYSNGADNRIATFTNASNLAGETALTFDGTTLGVGLSANINSPVIIIKQNPGQAGGGEIRIGAAGILSDENSGKLYLPGFRLIGLTNNTFKHQRYNNTTSAYETVFGIESANTANKDVTFRGDYLTISATNPRLVIDGPVGNSKGIRFNDAGSIRWYTGTLQNNSFVIQDVVVNDFPVSVLSGATGTVTIGTSTRKINIPNLTTSAVVVTDGSKNLVSSSITTTELGYLDGTSANLQNQLVALSANTALAANRYSTSINIMAGTNLYTITHNLGILRPHVDLFYNNEVVFASPKYIDINTLSITTTVPSTLNSVYIEVFK